MQRANLPISALSCLPLRVRVASVFFGVGFMSILRVFTAPVWRALQVVSQLFSPRPPVDMKPEIEAPSLPRLATRVAGPRETG
jgi:hypothetical protein